MHLSHDLRVVLDSIGACLNAIQRRPAPPWLGPEIDHARHLLDTAHALVDESLVSPSLKPIAPHVDVNAVLRDFGPILSTIVGRRIDVRMTLGAGDTRVYGQRADVERILLNLARNAAAAMPSGGVLWLDTEVVDDAAGTALSSAMRLTIRDTGSGMSEDALRAAIDPLAKPRLDGTGFGLACVATIVSRLGGRLRVERRDHGTLVSILLSLVEQRPAP